jgi:hypothetical protein
VSSLGIEVIQTDEGWEVWTPDSAVGACLSSGKTRQEAISNCVATLCNTAAQLVVEKWAGDIRDAQEKALWQEHQQRTTCVCGAPKEVGGVVCWDCFKYVEHPLKDSGLPFSQWLEERQRRVQPQSQATPKEGHSHAQQDGESPSDATGPTPAAQPIDLLAQIRATEDGKSYVSGTFGPRGIIESNVVTPE